MDFKCDELILGKTDADSRALTIAMYGASKAFVLNMTEALAAEYNNSGVHFMALCPGNTSTN